MHIVWTNGWGPQHFNFQQFCDYTLSIYGEKCIIVRKFEDYVTGTFSIA